MQKKGARKQPRVIDPYPSDLERCQRGAVLQPLIPGRTRTGGRPPLYERRAILNAIFCVVLRAPGLLVADAALCDATLDNRFFAQLESVRSLLIPEQEAIAEAAIA
jgi:transposase